MEETKERNWRGFGEDEAIKIYTMELHQIIETQGFTVTRVCGGWIYLSIRGQSFIPYENTFYSRYGLSGMRI